MVWRFIRSTLLFFTIWISLISNGQEKIFFDQDSDVFIQQIITILEDTPNKTYEKNGEDLMLSFLPRWQAGRFSKNEKDLIKTISESLYQKKYRNYPYFFDFFKALNALAYSTQPERSVLNWLHYSAFILEKQSQRDFGAHLEYSNDLLIEQILSKKGSTSWYLRNADYVFATDTALILQVDKGDLICATSRDSTMILNTSGVFNAIYNSWKGKGGNTVWWRFDLDEKDLKLNFKDYFIDLTASEYIADSVTFVYDRYFDFPMLGRFEDKVFNSPPGKRTSYPRFYAYFSEYELKEVFKNVSFRGGFAIEGLTIKGTGNGKNKAQIDVFQNNTLRLTLKSSEFIFSEDKLISENVSLNIPMERDSIYHPAAELRYDNQDREIVLFRTESGLADSPFFDSFHKLDLYFEALYWNIDEPTIYFKQLEGMRSESKGFLRSMNYFSFSDFDRLRLIDNQHPMFSIENYLKAYDKENEIKLGWYAEFIKKPEEQALSQLLRLAAEGYLVYDSDLRIAVLKERFFNTLKTRSGDLDHDVILINSNTSSLTPNIEMHLDSLSLNVSGVKELTLSNAQKVIIFPEDEFISFKRDRDFVFSGFVGAGLFEFYTNDSFFEYEDFKLNLTQVDSLSFFVPVFDQPARADGSRDYFRVRNVIADMSGVLYIDQPDNKSGKKVFPQYPIFDSKNESFVYFQKPYINENRLLKEEFFYVVNPFEIDSLDDFSTDNLRFEGYLNSASIFPAISEPLVVLPDYSLGFKYHTSEPEEMYIDKGLFADSIFLSNQGFWGKGSLNYSLSVTKADSFVFYPDEVKALAHSFTIKEQSENPSFPKAQSDTIHFNWFTDTNHVILQTVQKPIIFYNNVVFNGTAVLNPSELKASGELSFGQVNMKSDYLDFNYSSFRADTSDFTLLTALQGEPAFVAERYNALVDFEQRETIFESTGQLSTLSFPFNNYICTLDEAKWLMDEDKIDIRNTTFDQQFDIDALSRNELIDFELIGSDFISTHPDQDSLSFFSLQASYDIKTYAIEANNVKVIKTADVAVFPDLGFVRVLEGARMETLKNAYIIADRSNRKHHFSDADVTIFGRNTYEASGSYLYIDSDDNRYPIAFTAIFPDENGITRATGLISKEDQFRLGENFKYAGKAFLKANQPLLEFEGAFQLDYLCDETALPWVNFRSEVDAKNIRIPLDSLVMDENGKELLTGLYYDPTDRDYFAGFLSLPQSGTAYTAHSKRGILRYDRASNAYKLEDESQNSLSTSIDLGVNRCLIKGKGAINHGMNLPLVDLKLAGNYEYLMIPDSTVINSTMVFDFLFEEKLLQMMADSINRSSNKGALLSQSNYLYTIGLFSGIDEMRRIQSELSLYGSPRRIPEVFQKSFVFNNINLSWDRQKNAFISQGELQLSNIQRNPVNKSISGLVVLEKGRAGDAVTIYLQPNQNEWYYFHYENGIMQAISSSQDFNNRLIELKLEKRILEDKSSDFIYEYVIASRRSVVDFIRRYQLN